jgi:hypothetical protein
MSHPVAPTPVGSQSSVSNGFGITALVLGIVAVVSSFIPVLGMGAFILGPLAIIFGIVGIIRKGRKRGTSIAGLVLGVAAIIIAAIVTALTASFVDEVSKSVDESSAEVSVEYIATVNKGEATVTYGAMDGTSDATITEDWSETDTMTGFDAATLVVTGDFTTEGQEVSCELKINGESVAKNSGESSATCSGSNF